MLSFKSGMRQRFPRLTRSLGNTARVFYRVLGSRPHPEAGLPISRMQLHQGNEIDWSSIQQILERILMENILPFWHPGTLDEESGGYRLNHNLQGKWNGPNDKFLVSQARTLWFFSNLVNTGHGGSHHLEAASIGFRFLHDALWDSQFGGFYWSVDSNGRTPIKQNKELYAQAFGLFALSEYIKASQDALAMQLARELFGILEQNFHDPRHGGYREFAQRDWKPSEPNDVTYMNTPAKIKLMNSHLHVLEAFIAYYEVTKDSVVRERLVELLLIQSGTVVNRTVGACTDQFQENWKPFLDPNQDRVSYGHDLENIWMLIDACDVLGFPHSVFLELYRTAFDNALTFGCDHKKGGFYESGPLKRPADRLVKFWWVQAECLVGALYMHQLTGEKRYSDCFLRTLEWIVGYQVDWKHGDWHAKVNGTGNLSGEKAGRWKSPYHNGRAMMKCLQLLERPKPVSV